VPEKDDKPKRGRKPVAAPATKANLLQAKRLPQQKIPKLPLQLRAIKQVKMQKLVNPISLHMVANTVGKEGQVKDNTHTKIDICLKKSLYSM